MSARRVLWPLALLAGLPLVLYAPLLFGGRVLYWGVYLLQFYPWRKLAVEQIQAGHWPLWNPYLGAGTPLAANLQTAAFYPPNLLFLLMPVEHAFAWELALHVALAGLSAYWLGRTLGLSLFGALVAGLSYGLGGYILARWVFASMVYAAAWLPLLLALAERVIQAASDELRVAGGKRRVVSATGLLGLAIGIQFLAGHAQTSFYSLLILAAFCLWRLAQQWTLLGSHNPQHATDNSQLATRNSLLAACCLLLSLLGGLALAGIQLLPTAELAANSQRAGTLTDMRFAMGLSFWPWRLVTLIAPDFFGNPARDGYWALGTYWEDAAYAGILTLILAGLAVVAWWRGRRAGPPAGPLTHVPFFLGLALVSILLALGENTPLYPLVFDHVPGFGLFQAPARLMIGYALALPLLAGIGADALPLTDRVRAALRFTVVAGLGMVAAGGLARLLLPGIQPSFGHSALRLGASLALAAGLLLLRGRHLGGQVWRGACWQTLAVALIVVDLLVFGWGLAPGIDPGLYTGPVAGAGFLQSQPAGRLFVAGQYAEEIYDKYVSLESFGPTDPAYVRGLRESLHPNLNATHHLPGVGNYDPLTVGAYRELYDQMIGDEEHRPDLAVIRPLLDLFGARYLLTDQALDLPLIYDAGPRIYRNNTALPEAFVVYRARVVEDAEARQAALLSGEFDPRAEVLLSRAPARPLPNSREGSGSPAGVSLARPGPDRVEVQVDLPRAGYLVLTDTYYPGWAATVDGRPAEILEANHAFRALALDAGRHTISLAYRPLSFALGAGLTAAALLALVALAAITWLLAKNESARSTPPQDLG